MSAQTLERDQERERANNAIVMHTTPKRRTHANACTTQVRVNSESASRSRAHISGSFTLEPSGLSRSGFAQGNFACVSHFLPEPANGKAEVKPEERCRSSMHEGIGSSSDVGRGNDISGSADRRFAWERIICWMAPL